MHSRMSSQVKSIWFDLLKITNHTADVDPRFEQGETPQILNT